MTTMINLATGPGRFLIKLPRQHDLPNPPYLRVIANQQG